MNDVPPHGYLGRIVDAEGRSAGTCFQVTPGVLVTAWHVLDQVGAPAAGDEVGVGQLDDRVSCPLLCAMMADRENEARSRLEAALALARITSTTGRVTSLSPWQEERDFP